jgi:hypothetical protein
MERSGGVSILIVDLAAPDAAHETDGRGDTIELARAV